MSDLALGDAAWGGDLAAVRALLAQGADPDAEGLIGSVLEDALREGHLQVAAELLRAGARPRDPASARTTLAAAWRGGASDGVRLLASHDIDPSPLLLELARNDRPHALAAVLALGADPNVADDRGWTPLHLVAAYGSARAAMVLLDGGADREAATDDGLVSRTIAERNHRHELAALLHVPSVD